MEFRSNIAPLELAADPYQAWKISSEETIKQTTSGIQFTRLGSDTSEQPFEVPTKIGEVWQGSIGNGLSANVPLALPGDEHHTWPRGHFGESEAKWRAALAKNQPANQDDPALRVADVIEVWTTLRHFHPYPKNLHHSWDQMLDEALYAALRKPDVSITNIIRRMLSAIPDGHIWVKNNTELPPFTCPIRLQEVDGRAFVDTSALESIKTGDEILSFNEVPTRIALDKGYALTSGTDHQRRNYALADLRKGWDDQLKLRIRREEEILEIGLVCDQYIDEQFSLPPFSVLDDGLIYADIRKPDVIGQM